MENITVAIAQTIPHRQNLEANIKDHIRFASSAAANNADIIVFPEMSLTGYERELAEEQAFYESDGRLAELHNISINKNIIIVAGAPLKVEVGIYIASIIFLPDGSRKVYIKKYLHEGEDLFFKTRKDFNPRFTVKSENVSFAICYDIENEKHFIDACENKTTLYLASIFYTPNGIDDAHAKLKSHAKKYSMNIAMSNYGGTCWDIESGGKSAFWSDNGDLIINSDGNQECLLIVSRDESGWRGQKIDLITS